MGMEAVIVAARARSGRAGAERDLFSALRVALLLAGGIAVAQAAPSSDGSHPRPHLEAGRTQTLPDAPEIRLRPGLEIRCRFRLESLREGVQNLASKDGEWILRVDPPDEGGTLAFFVQCDGGWEPRLRGPVIRSGGWYDVRARWTGAALSLGVNGETFGSRREGSIRPGNKPLLVGPITGSLEEFALLNPAHDRSRALCALAENDRDGTDGHRFGDDAGWVGWQGLGGASCEIRDGGVMDVVLPSPSSMIVSPPLRCDLTALSFICLDVDAPGAGWIGQLDVVSDSGTGTIAFEPLGDGRTTLISGTASDAWMGNLRRLALHLSGGAGTVRVKRIVLSDRPVGVPWFYIQDFAQGRAKLRAGREETVIAGIKNLGGETENVAARLEVPEGVEVLGEAGQIIPYLGKDDFDLVTWRIRAAKPGRHMGRLEVSASGAEPRRRTLPLEFEAQPDLGRTAYVPEPRPATTDYLNLMHYCALWKEGTHYGWKRIEPWPGRRPAIGWYDEGTPEVADWHIKYAVEHGINGFIYCWYRAHLEPKIEHRLGHAIHDGLFTAKYRDRFQFCIMWENGCACGVKDADDLLTNVLPFWIENYFTHPSYVKRDNMPLLFVWQPRRLIPQLGGPEGTRQTFVRMRDLCRKAGFSGLRLIACMDGPDEKLGRDVAASGWDAVTGYILDTRMVPHAGIDPDGIPYRNYPETLKSYRDTWMARDASTGAVPDIPNVVMGWDPRPWHRGGDNGYIAGPRADCFEAACRDARALVDAKPAGRWDRNIVVFDNWTEFGEGHYIEPTSGLGFSFVNAIKRVFCTAWAPEAVTDVIPEDLGLAPPQRRYEEVRAAFGSRMPWQPLRIQGDLLAFWRFDSAAGGAFQDSSPNGLAIKSEGLRLEPGRGGLALRCGEGAATRPVPAPFFHPGGLTVSLWCKPSEAGQSDRWMVNTVSDGSAGYRLGLAQGRPDWQVPLDSWSHSLIAPEPLPVNEWSHLAATIDHRAIRLFVNGREVGMLERRGFVKPGRDLVVGGYSADLDRAWFRGWLDDVRLYRRPLSPEEIAELAR